MIIMLTFFDKFGEWKWFSMYDSLQRILYLFIYYEIHMEYKTWTFSNRTDYDPQNMWAKRCLCLT